jgi:hypothetical protein
MSRGFIAFEDARFVCDRRDGLYLSNSPLSSSITGTALAANFPLVLPVVDIFGKTDDILLRTPTEFSPAARTLDAIE